VETVTTGVIGDQSAIFVIMQVIHPWNRRVGPFNDIFLVFHVKVTVTHNSPFSIGVTAFLMRQKTERNIQNNKSKKGKGLQPIHQIRKPVKTEKNGG
jgi:hypothetical protein